MTVTILWPGVCPDDQIQCARVGVDLETGALSRPDPERVGACEHCLILVATAKLAARDTLCDLLSFRCPCGCGVPNIHNLLFLVACDCSEKNKVHVNIF